MADTKSSTATAAAPSGYSGGAKASAKATAAPAPYGGATIYLGPNIRAGALMLRTGTVFKAGLLPDALAGYVADDAMLAALIVPLDDMAATSAALARLGTVLNLAAATVAEKYAGGK